MRTYPYVAEEFLDEVEGLFRQNLGGLDPHVKLTPPSPQSDRCHLYVSWDGVSEDLPFDVNGQSAYELFVDLNRELVGRLR
jgi:hypothetical protein